MDVPLGVISLLSICLSRSRISYLTLPNPQSFGVLNSGYKVFPPTWIEGGSDSNVSIDEGVGGMAGDIVPGVGGIPKPTPQP